MPTKVTVMMDGDTLASTVGVVNQDADLLRLISEAIDEARKAIPEELHDFVIAVERA
ncbi:hypothetical protein [Methylocella sp. CPCC 101449]|jgi:hypothetical protein|uniref:hypothetical protein n=1 Tax=Methylocella sp. CPCC 101449 TaxID=2987531 RepID=UPI00288E4785|nr:hypothetical protein [Methylocella sp. CPCC 101449]MDT2022219.1 hypothetical protein [Methylocella sp. CPCC 101449]HEV2573056.1 hypothetical protein [Beijerinckiaceae bacterium]